MKRNDIDLDIADLASKIPEGDAIFYFRVSQSEDPDFLYAKGIIADLGEALATMMEQNDELVQVIEEAVKTYME